MFELIAEIASKAGIVESIVTLIIGIAQRVAEAGNDEGKLMSLSDDLVKHHTALAEAVLSDGAPVAVEPAGDPAEPPAGPADVAA